jgi:hypothetical protein
VVLKIVFERKNSLIINIYFYFKCKIVFKLEFWIKIYFTKPLMFAKQKSFSDSLQQQKTELTFIKSETTSHTLIFKH